MADSQTGGGVKGISRLLPRSRAARLTVIPAAGVLVVLVVAQLVLPPIAANDVRGRLGAGAEITSVKVSAFPAIELLWGQADSLELVMERYDVTPNELFGQIKQSGEVGTLTVAVKTLNTGVLTLHDVNVHKSDGQLRFGARVYTSDLQRALPIIQSVTPVASSNGDLTLRGTAAVLGARVSVTASVAAQDGKVVVAPQGLLGAFATVTVFDDPHLRVQRISGHAVPGGLEISAEASYQ
jgi:hypothetical protein